eukprot:TRINITY_DN18538_c0_g1_i1.p2 TRINITY_DN18538_c0_g1~~TRINITY_DN18538_c0_g1_i1.p2  ORF type:complete len:134 (+),score=45.85 TRINITY_DN18538_c0_g1_i1:213-614(+)
MRVLLLALALALCAAALASDSSDFAKLQIGVKSRPDECTRKSKSGDTLSMHYTGKLTDGTKFDSSLDRGTPFEFTLGSGQVIQGWERGLKGMCVGEKRRLKIPSSLGYGANGMPPTIPASAGLVFEVELLEIK